MKQTILILTLLASAGAQASPFAKGNAEIGGKLHAQQCNACHASKFNGDANLIYYRADRRVKNADQLGQRIGTCNAMLGLNLFPEDELNLGAYLNKTFYKFK
jgi:mono/diheme cytochrome c family protein